MEYLLRLCHNIQNIRIILLFSYYTIHTPELYFYSYYTIHTPELYFYFNNSLIFIRLQIMNYYFIINAIYNEFRNKLLYNLL